MALEVKTEHPHIVRAKAVRGGRPIIKGTSIEVALIAKLYKMGESVDEILLMYPHLTPSAVHDALSYYHDHQIEMEHIILHQDLNGVLQQNALVVDERGRVVPKKQ